MRLLTFRATDNEGRPVHRVGRLDGVGADDDTVVQLDGVSDLGQLMRSSNWRQVAQASDGPRHRYGGLDLAPVVPHPTKIVCVGLNYRAHILEMGRDLPQYPTLFAKYPATLTGPDDTIAAPPEDAALDWEAELTVVVGRSCRRVGEKDAVEAIAGYTVANDISMRTWQFRTKEWLQGKMWEASTPVGPCLVTADEWQPGPAITTRVNGEQTQSATTDDLLFGPATLVSYISTMITLSPGDLILTGTPGGVGRAMQPPRYLRPGDIVETGIDGLGSLRNRIVEDAPTG
ncbi:fumarylacetoacetate hydrolase family protein [Segeticoccus rhizosphaerae]|jgi:acylpyruvate hydrolase|uniref:fumarylacetoacetate hydrolase family protein n=1 Tax=Segeticoccus rhizosphaerae TaxID=1104777 RepID=UPI001265856C|nr:fumarylacetoacetate hydrolase family protein [Segeticoccus rhizosphaerae]